MSIFNSRDGKIPTHRIGLVDVYIHADNFYSLEWMEDGRPHRKDSRTYLSRVVMLCDASDEAGRLDEKLKQLSPALQGP